MFVQTQEWLIQVITWEHFKLSSGYIDKNGTEVLARKVRFLTIRAPLTVWHAHITSNQYSVHHVQLDSVVTANMEQTINWVSDGHEID